MQTPANQSLKIQPLFLSSLPMKPSHGLSMVARMKPNFRLMPMETSASRLLLISKVQTTLVTLPITTPTSSPFALLTPQATLPIKPSPPPLLMLMIAASALPKLALPTAPIFSPQKQAAHPHSPLFLITNPPTMSRFQSQATMFQKTL